MEEVHGACGCVVPVQQGACSFHVLRLYCALRLMRRDKWFALGLLCSLASTNPLAILQELSKVLDGFTVADTLVIKAQVQVIL